VRFLFLLPLILPLTSHASLRVKWKNFCEKFVSCDDPYPYAEVDSPFLLHLWKVSPSEAVTKELVFRYRAGMLTESEKKLFILIGRRK